MGEIVRGPIRPIPVTEFSPAETFANGRVGTGDLPVNGRVHRIRTTTDFDLGDHWSNLKLGSTDVRRERGAFRGRSVIEAGIGDGRNVLRTGVPEESRENPSLSVIGVDVEAWRANLARENLLSVTLDERLTILVGGATNHLLTSRLGELPPAAILACLPQAPMGETHNTADGINEELDYIEGGRNVTIGPHTPDQYGLLLNTAYARAARPVVAEDGTDLQMTLSGRIPTDAISGMFTATGWQLKEVYRTESPVPHDVDTGLFYMTAYANDLDPARGEGLFTRTDTGFFVPISPEEGEERRAYAEKTGEPITVFHHVSEYVVTPSEGEAQSKQIPVYEIKA